MTKICTKCGIEQDLIAFYKYNDRYYSKCKTCIKEYQLRNKDKIKKYRVQYKINNKKNILIYNAKWRSENRDSQREYSKWYKTERKDKRRQVILKYKLTHKEERRIYERNRWNSDVNYKLRKCASARIRAALKHLFKSESTQELVGCTMQELKLYLESKFQPGMTWDNYGTWHIDHFWPCAMFNLSDYQERKFCFHYTNLQPLWAKDNIMKSDSLSNI